MNNLSTRKIVLGMLMTLVLAFSMQSTADALTLSATSDTTQIKQPNDAPFEIQFSTGVGSGSGTIAYNDETPRRRVTHHNDLTSIASEKIDTQGYVVTHIGSTEYRLAGSTLAQLRPTTGTSRSVVTLQNSAQPTRDVDDNNVAVPNQAATYSGGILIRSAYAYATDGTPLYIRTGLGSAISNFTYTQAQGDPAMSVPVSERFDYNEESITVTVVPVPAVASMTVSIKNDNYVLVSPATLTEMSGVLKSSITLVCDTTTAGTYTITIVDSTDAEDFPRNAVPVAAGTSGRGRSKITFTLHVTTESEVANEEIVAQKAGATDAGVAYLRVDTGKKIEHISADFKVSPEAGHLEIRYKVIRGRGTLYAAETSTTGTYRGPNQDLTVHQDANVFLNTNGTTNEVAASIAGSDRQTSTATIVYEYSGTDAPGTTPPPITPPPTGSLTISVTGTGATRSVTVIATSAVGTPVAIVATLTGTALASTRVVTTGTATEITLPTTPDDYTLTATAAVGGYSPDTEIITVAGPTSLGTLSILEIGTATNGVQPFSITVRGTDGNRIAGALTVRVRGPGINTSVLTAAGSGAVNITLPTATGPHAVTVSATDYTSGTTSFRGTGTGQQQQVADEEEEEETVTVSEPDSISIVGPSQRDGTVNEELGAALVVEVVDDDGEAVEDARVIFRVRSGQGRLSQRGRGRAIAVQTDSRGHARANYTPTGGGTHTVEAEVRGVTRTVEFTITTGSAPPPRDLGTREEPSPTVSPVVHVGAAQRPPMLWVDGGAIYALVGADVKEFAPSVDNALNIAVGGGKVYWTEKTGESGGTINSANLNGSDVTELTSIKAVPMGIAVDTAGSKLYWTNSRGRIQSANLDGSGITNVIPGGLESPMDIALAGGNAYWTQGNGSVRFVNLRGAKQIRNVSTGTDTPGSLVIGGGKVYWTEMTGESGGTVNSANLNGTGATQLASIKAVPMGIAVDGSRSKLYWTNSRGRIQSANLDGSRIQSVVDGLGSPAELVLSNSITAPAAAPAGTASGSKYDVNGDGTVDNADSDALIIAVAAKITDAKYDVNGDGTVDIHDVVAVSANRDPGAAGAPTLFGMKLSALQIDLIQEQIDLLIATNDRSPAAMRVLVYLQQLLVTARPEKTQLLANYPNPFNPETWIPYELATDTHVRLTIYNTQGVVIRSIPLGHQSAGYYTGRDRAAYWDGRNALGEQVASGLYFYQLETDEMSSLRKMVILK